MSHLVAVEKLNCPNIFCTFISVFVIRRRWCPVILWFPVAVIGSSFDPRFPIIILVADVASGIVMTITFEVILLIALVVIRVFYSFRVSSCFIKFHRHMYEILPMHS